ncbi:MAG: nitroreductase [Capsulimonas sp.]|nr:nitroreductase [Capsulimonas sp.]
MTDQNLTLDTHALDSTTVEALQQAIAHRRSLGVARLKPDAVNRYLIEQMLEAANWAPSHGETEPWRFTVFTGDSRIALGEAFAEAYRQDTGEGFQEATFEAQKGRALMSPVWISIGMQPAVKADGSLRMDLEDERVAVGCAVQNLHLVASAQGLAGMWLSKNVFIHPHIAEFVGLTAPAQLMGFFIVGWPNIPWPAGERGPLSEKVRWAE